jgi:putative phosphoribosyl transferase
MGMRAGKSTVRTESEKDRSVEVAVRSDRATLDGTLALPSNAPGIVLFAHGSGSSRFSSRNRYVAGVLNRGGLATLLFDLLTAEEHRIDEWTRELRFDIDLLTKRLVGAVDWLEACVDVADLPVGLFGASTGAAAALRAAALRPERVAAVVSRGGRPDLAMNELPRVRAPTLLVVGGDDGPVIGMNREAAAHLACEHRLEIVPGATHLFEEPGKLERVAELARDWFLRHLERGAVSSP